MAMFFFRISNIFATLVSFFTVERGGDAEELSAVAGAVLALCRCIESFEALPSLGTREIPGASRDGHPSHPTRSHFANSV